MTAGKSYEYCAIGYKANHYENLEGLTPKEQYYQMADGRDEGLSEINSNSYEEFEIWYHDRHRSGGHPWEVCRGGNSTHIDLYVRHDKNGYFLSVRGKAWTRSIEAIKFYNALRAEGVAVYLHDAKGITDRLLGKDRIGIVPEHVIPSYCEAWFPGMDILDFMNLPYEQDEYELMLPKITWLEEPKQELLKKYMNLPYKMEIVPDKDEGGFVASFPDLPGCISIGETIEATIQNVIDAKKAWLESELEMGGVIPGPNALKEYSGLQEYNK